MTSRDSAHGGKAKRKWYQIQWFSDQDSPRERKLVTKLDLLIVPYAFLAYWVKYIDQNNLNNAYVAGLKEDLGFEGNELIQLQTMYTIGAVLGQLPFLFLLPYIPIHYLIPFLDIAWGIFTLLQFRANSFAELAAYRFLVGWFEAAFFPAMHYTFGSWYKGHEIGRRGGMFYVGLTLGTLTAGLIQAGASARLDGVSGLAGWRWMYIICAIITIPVGVLGYFVLPGSPDKPNRIFLNDQDIAIARERLERAGHGVENEKVSWATIKKLVATWEPWALLLLDIFFWNGGINYSTGGYLLWLKSLGRFSKTKINELGAISPALGIFYTLAICFSSDLLWGPAWAMTVSFGLNILGLAILVAWDVPESALWFAFMTTYFAVALSSVLYGWINSTLRASPAQRSFSLVLLNMIAQSTTAWTGLLTFPTVEAPKFRKGYSYALANSVCLIITAHVIQFCLKRRDAKAHDPETASNSELSVADDVVKSGSEKTSEKGSVL